MSQDPSPPASKPTEPINKPAGISDRLLAYLSIIVSVVAIIGTILTAATVVIGLKSDVKRLDDEFGILKMSVTRNDESFHTLQTQLAGYQVQINTLQLQ